MVIKLALCNCFSYFEPHNAYRGHCGNPNKLNMPKNLSEFDFYEFDYGFPNYDNIINASITLFIGLTGQGWSNFYYAVWE